MRWGGGAGPLGGGAVGLGVRPPVGSGGVPGGPVARASAPGGRRLEACLGTSARRGSENLLEPPGVALRGGAVLGKQSCSLGHAQASSLPQPVFWKLLGQPALKGFSRPSWTLHGDRGDLNLLRPQHTLLCVCPQRFGDLHL